MNSLSCTAVAFVLTVLAIVVLRPMAFSLNLLDRPGGRKSHVGEVPLIGGLAMFIGLVAALGLAAPNHRDFAPLLAVFAIMVLTGMFDDRFSISPWMRLCVHLVAGVILVATTDAVVHTIGDPFGTGAISLTAVGSLLFTLMLMTGAVNSFNMLDGMDGLAGIVSIISLAGLAGLSVLAGTQGVELTLCMVLGAATLGFMVFNVPIATNRAVRCFMGDAGSTLIGVAIAWLCVRISQQPVHGTAHPVYVLWMVALPIYELFWTVIRRVVRGRSPLHADAGHFHHMLTRAGLNVRAAFVAFLLIDVALVGIGFLLIKLRSPDWVCMVSLVVVGAVVVRGMYEFHRLVAWLPAFARHHHQESAGIADR